MTTSSLIVKPNGDRLRIRDVWASNLEQEMAIIRRVVDEYPFVAMDTEFPGVVTRPIGSFKNQADYHYQTLRLNVDMLKIIQLGLTFADEEGSLPSEDGEYCVWQFNFRDFRLDEDIYNQDSIDLLKESGIDFRANEEKGIETLRFAELLVSSGIVLNEEIRWITFHSGYDFGYLFKLLTCKELPADETEFFELLRIFFPVIYDIKYLMKFCENLHGGLSRVAEALEVERWGPLHQAGSDSLLTAQTYVKLVKQFFNNNPVRYQGILYGLGTDSKEVATQS